MKRIISESFHVGDYESPSCQMLVFRVETVLCVSQSSTTEDFDVEDFEW